MFVALLHWESILQLWLHDFPGPNSIDQALAQDATHNKYL